MGRFIGFFVALCLVSVVHAETITVSAAVSLKEALTTVGTNFEKETGNKVEFNFGASGQLVQQVLQGAPVDAFISASQKQIEDLKSGKMIGEAVPQIVARNSLVLIVPAGAKSAPDTFASLAAASVKRIAVGQPKTVPAGDYAMQTLAALTLEAAVKERLVFAANVRQVLDYVTRGEVDAGVVYATDAREGGEQVRVVATAPEDSHSPIEYPAVVIKGSTKQVTAAAFLNYLLTPTAQKVLAEKGFAAGGALTTSNQPSQAPAP